MRIGRTALVFAIALMGAAAFATAAHAMVWAVGSTKFTSGQSETVTAKAKSKAFTLESKVGSTAFKMTATGLECIGCKIDQIGTGAEGEAHGVAKFKLTGVSIVEPSACQTGPYNEGENVTRKGFRLFGFTLWETFKTDPFSSEEVALTTVKLENCAIAGTYPLTGSLTAKLTNGESLATEQIAVFSAANQKEGGGSLKFGGVAATLTGEMATSLSGKNAGKEWGMLEK
jgi:hypothetical protein